MFHSRLWQRIARRYYAQQVPLPPSHNPKMTSPGSPAYVEGVPVFPRTNGKEDSDQGIEAFSAASGASPSGRRSSMCSRLFCSCRSPQRLLPGFYAQGQD